MPYDYTPFSLSKLGCGTNDSGMPCQNPDRAGNGPAVPGGNGAELPERPIPETVQSTLFVPGYLQTQIGKLMRVDFLIGNSVESRTGRLAEVGAAYIILQQLNVHTMCDLFSIKFAVIIDDPQEYCETVIREML